MSAFLRDYARPTHRPPEPDLGFFRGAIYAVLVSAVAWLAIAVWYALIG